MDPRNIDTFRGLFPVVLLVQSCGFGVKKCGCSGGPNKLVHFSGKVLDLTIGRLSGRGIEAHPSPGEALAETVWATVGLVGVVAGVVEVALGAATPSWPGRRKTKQLRGEASELRTFGGR